MATAIWRTVTSGKSRDELITGAVAKGRVILYGDFLGMPGSTRQVLAKVSTTQGVTYRLAVIRGDEFSSDKERTYGNVRAEGIRRGYPNPPAEVALLLAQYSQQELDGSNLIVMHDPINYDYGLPHVLGVLSLRRLDRSCEASVKALALGQGSEFCDGFSFVFLVPTDTP